MIDNSKSESRNPKQIRISNIQNAAVSFCFEIRTLNLFRISCFGFEQLICITYFYAAANSNPVIEYG